uniref:Uncharacterized protein n=1 Tax=Ailuropoda melanoleuca TaxID=9646 RepID=A0A7N5JZS3_AILME
FGIFYMVNHMAMGVLDPLKQLLESRCVVQLSVPPSLASGFLCCCSCGFVGAQVSPLLGLLPYLSSFSLQPVHSLLPSLGLWPGGFQNGANADSKCTYFFFFALYFKFWCLHVHC